MTRLNKTTTVIFSLLVVVIFLFGFWIYNQPTPNNPSVNNSVNIIQSELKQPNFNQQQSRAQKVTYSGPSFSPPKEFVIYSAEQTNYQDLLETFINTYNLRSISGFDVGWVSKDKKNTLTHNPITHRIELSFIQSQTASKTMFNPEKTIQTAASYLKNHGINFPKEFTTTSIQYLKNSHEPTKTDPSTAGIAKVVFSIKVDSYDLVFTNKTQSEISVALNQDYKPLKIVIDGTINTIKQHQKLPSLQLNDTLFNIEKGDYTLINSYSLSELGIVENNFITIEFNNYTIEYRNNINTVLLLPYYRFTGVGTDSNNKTHHVEIITPAINSTK